MTAGTYLPCTCMVFLTLALRNAVTAGGDASQAKTPEIEVAPALQTLSLDELPDDETATEDEKPKTLLIYDGGESAVTNLFVAYLKEEGPSCTNKRLIVSIVGENGEDTPVESVLEKLSSIFNVKLRYGQQTTLFMSKGTGWRALSKPSLFRRLCGKRLDPLDHKTLVKDLGTDKVFVGRMSGKKSCETMSLLDAPLAALPVATESALPALTMEAKQSTKSNGKSAGYPSFSLLHTFSTEELLQRMLKVTDHLYWAEEKGDTEESGNRKQQTSEKQAADEKQKLDPHAIYLHTQAQLDLLFPSKTYFPVRVLDSVTGEIVTDVQAVHAYPASASSYVCCSSRYLRLDEMSWNEVRNPDSSNLRRGRLQEPPLLLARLLAARPGSVSEQQPQVVLLGLYRSPESGREVWKETLLTWELSEIPETTEQSRHPQTFGEKLAANSRLASSLTTAFSESSLSRLLVNQMIKLYNINKEEMMSMWDKEPEHSALKLTSAQAVFTRPINTAVLRPVLPVDVLVAPADSVIQRMYQLAPDDDGDIRDMVIPQIKGTTFHLMDFLYGEEDGTSLRLTSKGNRLNVVIHYLSPQDYHRVHSPADWIIQQKNYMPGCTPSVNRKNLSRNSVLNDIERTSLIGTWDPEGRGDQLFFSVTLVAATFVGGLSLSWEENPSKPRTYLRDCSKISQVLREEIEVPMCTGQELGSFRLGSTVVLIFESPPGFDPSPMGSCGAVRLGQTEGRQARGTRSGLSRCAAYPSAYATPIDYLGWLQQNREKAGKTLIKNTQLPASWRTSPATVAEETIRFIEKGLLNANALAQQIFHMFAKEQQAWTNIIVGQPVTLLKHGGYDSSHGKVLPLCFPSTDKKQIHVKLQGQHSTLVLFFATTGKETLLFKEPHFGCDGDPHLGSTAGGITATWRAGDRGDLDVQLSVQCGMGGEDQCAVQDGAALLVGSIQVQAKCSIDWGMLLPGSATSECTVKKVESAVTSAHNFDLKTKDLIC